MSVLQTHHPNPALQSLFHALDPISLILRQSSNSDQPVPLTLTTESYIMERGPKYKEYAELRECKLRMKMIRQEEPNEPETLNLTPPRKQVKFQANFTTGRKGSSVLAQSVPDFSAALRKENRKPMSTLPSMLEMTPPSKSSSSKTNGVLPNKRGSKSANSGEKRSGGSLMGRKSYANVEELKNLSSAASNAINGENRGARTSRAMGKTVLGFRQF